MQALEAKLKREWDNVRNWRFLNVFQGFLLVGVCIYFNWANMQTERIAIVSGNTYYIGKSDPVLTSEETHREITKIAMAAIFSRKPEGFMLPEVLIRVVNTPVYKGLEKDAKADQQVFWSQQMTQIFVPDKIAEKPLSSDTVAVVVDGVRMRNYKFEGKAVAESQPMRILIKLFKNDMWTEMNKYPMVVTDFKQEVINP